MLERVKSPTYPSLSLPRCLELAEKVRRSALKGHIDTRTAVELMGFKSVSGPASSALSAVKRFGLLEGRDQKIRVTNLARRILQPLDETEKAEAIREAASRPELYAHILRRFGGDPPSDSVIVSYIMRTFDFTQTGADTFVRAFRETVSFATTFGQLSVSQGTAISVEGDPLGTTSSQKETNTENPIRSGEQHLPPSEVLQFRLTSNVSVKISFEGTVTSGAIDKLAKILEITKDSYPPADDESAH